MIIESNKKKKECFVVLLIEDIVYHCHVRTKKGKNLAFFFHVYIYEEVLIIKR